VLVDIGAKREGLRDLEQEARLAREVESIGLERATLIKVYVLQPENEEGQRRPEPAPGRAPEGPRVSRARSRPRSSSTPTFSEQNKGGCRQRVGPARISCLGQGRSAYAGTLESRRAAIPVKILESTASATG